MTVERADPIPPGTYTLDVLSPDALERFKAWMYETPVEVLKSDIWEDPFLAWYQFRLKKAAPRWKVTSDLALPERSGAAAQSPTEAVEEQMKDYSVVEDLEQEGILPDLAGPITDWAAPGARSFVRTAAWVLVAVGAVGLAYKVAT